MMYEFEWAYPRLVKGGVLVADDITWNKSFYDFAEKTGDTLFFIRTSKNHAKGGVLVKGFKEKLEISTLDEFFREKEAEFL